MSGLVEISVESTVAVIYGDWNAFCYAVCQVEVCPRKPLVSLELSALFGHHKPFCYHESLDSQNRLLHSFAAGVLRKSIAAV
jgi:hypothetical protein